MESQPPVIPCKFMSLQQIAIDLETEGETDNDVGDVKDSSLDHIPDKHEGDSESNIQNVISNATQELLKRSSSSVVSNKDDSEVCSKAIYCIKTCSNIIELC